MNDYGPKKNRGYRQILVMRDKVLKIVRTIPLKNKYAQSIRDAFPQVAKTSESKPNLLETYNGTENANEKFNEFLNKSNSKRYSRKISLGCVLAERLNRIIKKFFEKASIWKGKRWLDIWITICYQEIQYYY